MTLKITKYLQSCMVVETAGVRLLIDPGSFVVNDVDPDEFGELDAVLYTHSHADHFDPSLLEPLAQRGARFVANREVAAQMGDYDVTVLEDRDETDIGGVRVRAHELAHCPMVDGSPGPLNIGFVIDDVLLHPGDGVEAPAQVEVVAVPIAGPSISFRDAYRMLEAAGASHAVPMHYDSFIADPHLLAKWCDLAEIHVLGNRESATFDVGQP